MDNVVTLDIPEFRTRTPTRPEPPLADEQRAFARLLPELLHTHRGQYVAVFGGRVVGSGADLFAVLSQAYAEHGYWPILCRLVTDEPRVFLPLTVHLAVPIDLECTCARAPRSTTWSEPER